MVHLKQHGADLAQRKREDEKMRIIENLILALLLALPEVQSATYLTRIIIGAILQIRPQDRLFLVTEVDLSVLQNVQQAMPPLLVQLAGVLVSEVLWEALCLVPA